MFQVAGKTLLFLLQLSHLLADVPGRITARAADSTTVSFSISFEIYLV